MSEYEMVEGTQPYYDRLSRRSAVQQAHEMVVEWNWADDPHGYCLAAFLLARFEEEKALALAEWPTNVGNEPLWGKSLAVVPNEPDNSRTEYHLAIDPARVLADCETRRRVVELHSRRDDAFGPGDTCSGDGSSAVLRVDGNCPTLRALAQPYAGHAEFDPSWAL